MSLWLFNCLLTDDMSSIHGLKSIGYVPFMFYTPPPAPQSHSEADTSASSSNRPYVAIALAALALFAAFTIPIIYK